MDLSYTDHGEMIDSVDDFPTAYCRHYITTDSQGLITDGWSDGPHPERDTSGAILINEGGGYQFQLLGEENPQLYTVDGIHLYKWDGERVVARTAEEIDADRNKPDELPQHVPEPTALSVVKVLRAMAPSLPLNVAVEAPELYPEWKPGVDYGGQNQPQLVSRMVDGHARLFKCQTPHRSQEDWAPEVTASLWFQVVKEGTGTYDDPFVVSTNLSQQYYKDKYYLEDGVIYLCTRDSGIPIAYKPSQLIGHYFEVVS